MERIQKEDIIMNYIQYLDDKQLQVVVGGGHEGAGSFFGEFKSADPRPTEFVAGILSILFVAHGGGCPQS